ncbi:hypothetical protein AB733_15495 [Photobacterium swingsii]|uniref:Resolvase/invertase-type recombinase catalytic domain-containing protein n=1 Tax=Photobacterium swingsii TaxID=680026 RepID=A0A0J8XWZ6_9GAMM|nr:hypothetical protein AB733_15495 [Photobacterium swingsii]PSW26019.1 hypothetical protein C9I94_05565 [Photobacterium swingsii]
MNTVAYIRTSNIDETEDVVLIKTQKSIIDEWAYSNNNIIGKYYIDSRHTIHNKQRIQFEKMIKDINDNHKNIEGIVVTDFYRLARKPTDIVRLLTLTQNLDIQIIVLSESFIIKSVYTH